MRYLESEIKFLKGVGPKRAELLEKELGLRTLDDLLHFYPFRYIDRSKIHRIADAGQSLAYIQIMGKVVSRALVGEGSGKRVSVIVDDGSGQMEMVFFKALKWNYEKLEPGKSFVFYGKPGEFNGKYNMVHPEVDAPMEAGSNQGGLSGVYPSTEKLKSAGITGKLMCKLANMALGLCLEEVEESLPDYLLKELALCSLPYALNNIHFPKDSYALEKASRRLKFEELFLLQLSLLKQKFVNSRQNKGFIMPKVGREFNDCFKALPYSLTGAQQRVIKEIRNDLLSGSQMNRLLQGDVGSGKTMVAVLSCLLAIDNGFQTCIMAPTEVLAQQHFSNISKYLSTTNVRCALLTGSTKSRERKEIAEGLEDGSIGLIVGTHTLIEDSVQFKNLGLAVIDEQHRFGVDQRAKLWSKNAEGAPHVLVMTATPIPRTLAMTVYGDLDVSVIDEMPPGRKPVRTSLHTENKLPVIYNFMRKEIAKGRQVFVVYPMIFENEKLDLQNLEQGYEQICQAFPFPPYKVAFVHGRQSAEEKNFYMSAFSAGRANILVSTTVIEVGVDVPNASVMVIMGAERFGLSQLHQLRGRVGRGSDESHCVLVRGHKCSKDAIQRLELMCRSQDGFEIAEEDLKLRGPGDLEGTAQSGLPIELKIASLVKDSQILSEARAVAKRVLDEDPLLAKEKNLLLLKELRKGKYEKKDYSKIS